MDNLTIIENQLVPVYETSTGEKVVYGTELYEVLGVKSRFNDWIRNRLNDCEAIENVEFESFTKNLVSGGQSREYIIKLDTAKEMAMLERNEKGKQVRRYFIQVEKKYISIKVDSGSAIQDLSPQLQLLINMELLQKEQGEKLDKLVERTNKQTEALQTVKEAMISEVKEENFSKWVTESIGIIANSPDLDDNPYRYQVVWSESYKRLTDKARCNLNTLLKNAKKRATENGSTKSKVKAISKLSVIADNKRLKELYISVIREMMIAFRVEVA